ncbi:class I SAM-dependent methyltransferase [Vibrio sp. WXL210]|uniref:class I SAM-dependent methyltransferase n=1 Tax=Vibrio sp. WXL210 TaxID=3450709 RepID=UPI003EC7F9A9
MQIDNTIARTLFIPLYMKAKEAKRKDGFFDDEVACQLIEQVDFDFSVFDNALRSQIGCVLRANYFDQLVCQFLQTHPQGVIVNVGCGLDARYERICRQIQWPETALLYDLDLPEVMDLRGKLFTHNRQNPPLAGSLFEQQWLEEIYNKHGNVPVFFIIEGVLMYFDIDRVKDAVVQMVNRFSQCQIAFDSSTSLMCKLSNHHDAIKHTSAEFKLCLDNPYDVETWHPSIKLKSIKRYSDFKRWRGVGWFNYWSMRLVPPLNNASCLLHLEANDSSSLGKNKRFNR